MKRVIHFLLFCVILFTMSGCESGEKNGISFYYCRNPGQYQYFEENGVICAESRELLGHRNDLNYMVGLYLAGPMDEGLASPFTKSTRLLSIQKENQTVIIELSDHSKSLSDSEFTLSCACLTLTCMEFIPCDEITIISGSRSVTMDAQSILLFDALPQQESIGG